MDGVAVLPKMYDLRYKKCSIQVVSMLEKPLSEARKDLSRIVADCAKNEVTVITVRGVFDFLRPL